MGARGFRRFVLFTVLTAQLVSQGFAAPQTSIIGGLQTRAQKIATYLGFSKAPSDGALSSQRTSERNPNFLSDRDLLVERRYTNDTLGSVDTRFISELDTRVYYTATGRPNELGKVPVIDPEAKGLFIFFHGSGTHKAGGGNFTLKMNRLAQLGYAAIGFDFPWHQDGSQNPKLSDSKEFMEYLYNLIQTLRPGGMPVYLVGHSFGPEIISELVTRYPYLVNGAALISPGGSDDVMKKWYEEKTVKMPFMADLNAGGGNEKGARWAGEVTKHFVWNRPQKRADPTAVNPRLKLQVVYGDREEYIPGPLNADESPAPYPRTYDVCAVYRAFFAGIKCTVEPGVGHYIFEHKDANGHDVIMRTLLDLAGETIENEKALKLAQIQAQQKSRSISESNLSAYSKEIFFRNWIDRTVGKQHLLQLRDEKNEKASQLLYNDFKMVLKQRDTVLIENIRKTKDLAPEFYQTVEALLEASSQKSFDASTLFVKYLQFLNSAEGEKFLVNAFADEKVYVLPEKKQTATRAPDPQEIERLRAQKQLAKQQAAEAKAAAPVCSGIVTDQAS